MQQAQQVESSNAKEIKPNMNRFEKRVEPLSNVAVSRLLPSSFRSTFDAPVGAEEGWVVSSSVQNPKSLSLLQNIDGSMLGSGDGKGTGTGDGSNASEQ